MSRFASSRRRFLGTVAAGAAYFTTRGLFAEELLRSPSLTEGPFYPTHLPLDKDNDLIVVGESTTPAVGEVTHLTGRVLDASGSPMKNVVVEIWQCDAKEVYHLTRDEEQKRGQMDKNFQGFGRFETGSAGEYRFRTIKPVPYPGRPSPHIHYKVKKGDRELITSQIFVEGHDGNRRDGVFAGLADPLDRALCSTVFAPVEGSKIGELAARFDIVIGRTPDERNRG